MKNKFAVSLLIAILAFPSVSYAGLFGKKKVNSTTVTGRIVSANQDRIVFEAVDGQNLILTGKKAEAAAKNIGLKLRVFGNVIKSDEKYPLGGIRVRNFRILEAVPSAAIEEIIEIVPLPSVSIQEDRSDILYPPASAYPEPEPYLEPEKISEIEIAPPIILEQPVLISKYEEPEAYKPIFDEYDDEPVVIAKDEAVGPKTYVVKSGDTLGKISKLMYGTTAKWQKLADYNGISDPKYLKIGMTLQIPEL